MSKFKVGDTVKVTSCNGCCSDSCSHTPLGTICKITRLDADGGYHLSVGDKSAVWHDDELELVECNLRSKEMNIVTLAKFIDKDQRALYKAGLIDSSGQLTEDGRVLVLEQIAQQPDIKKALLEIAKEFKAEKKDC